MEIGAAEQLLGNAVQAAKFMGRPAKLQEKWAALFGKLPECDFATDGSLRGCLWPEIEENNSHRHASNVVTNSDLDL